MKPDLQFRLRLYRDEVVAVGPGKVTLLEAIARTGSISAAAREINMSYRRAWVLVDERNQSLRSPVVSTATGGHRGGSDGDRGAAAAGRALIGPGKTKRPRARAFSTAGTTRESAGICGNPAGTLPVEADQRISSPLATITSSSASISGSASTSAS